MRINIFFLRTTCPRNSRGFTLIELLVSIAIIGILASFVLNSLSGTKEKTRDAVRAGDLKSLGQAAESYFTEHNGRFPANDTWVADLNPYFANDTIPKDPTTRNDYEYKVLTSPKGYCLGAIMETEAMHNDTNCLGSGFNSNYQIKGP